MDKEFEVGTEVTIDRYNHVSNPSKGIVVGYGTMPISGRLTYKVNIDNCIIQTTGISIKESKNYEPASENERHGYDIKEQREKERLEDAAWFNRTKMQ